MEIYVSGKPVSLTGKDVLGAGGEATVFSKNGVAYKIYHKPTVKRGEKLAALLSITSRFPKQVLAPLELAMSKSGKVVGYVMPLAPSEAEAIKFLANKNFRAANGITTKDVANILLSLGKVLTHLHPLGVVVGDLNDLNELFAKEEVYYVDSDSFQFGKYGCAVGTEDYLCPTLYNRSLGKEVSFSRETDWYSYAVLLYRSLLLVHPYGGVYPKLPTLVDRAKKGITILDPAVKYPKLGANPEILTDELLEQFRKIFEKGEHKEFPLGLVEDYIDLLVPCKKCGEFYPSSRGTCPRCSAPTVLPVSTLTARFIEKLLFKTNGTTIFSRVTANNIYVVAREEGTAVLYHWKGGRAQRFPLFAASGDLIYEVAMEKLVVGKKGSNKLLLVDPETKQIQKTETGMFSGSPAFAATENYLYRLAGGLLLRSELYGEDLLDQAVGTVLVDQTWVAASSESGDERLVMISRVFERWLHQVQVGNECYDGEVNPLEEGEKLVGLKVKFDNASLLLIRQTKKNGKSYLRLDLLDKHGKSKKHTKRTWNEAKHGQIWQAAYLRESLVYYAEDGLIQENLLTGKLTKFSGSGNILVGTEVLYPWRGKLLAIGENKVSLIEKGG